MELAAGRTVEDVVAAYANPVGPPPMRSLGGAAVRSGEDAGATLHLGQGRSYAFVCAISDTRSDFRPQVVKGMFTEAFSVN